MSPAANDDCTACDGDGAIGGPCTMCRRTNAATFRFLVIELLAWAVIALAILAACFKDHLL